MHLSVLGINYKVGTRIKIPHLGNRALGEASELASHTMLIKH